MPNQHLLIQHIPQVPEPNAILPCRRLGLVANRPQRLHAGRVDALHGVDELQLALEGGDHGGLLGGGAREGQRGEAQEVV